MPGSLGRTTPTVATATATTTPRAQVRRDLALPPTADVPAPACLPGRERCTDSPLPGHRQGGGSGKHSLLSARNTIGIRAAARGKDRIFNVSYVLSDRVNCRARPRAILLVAMCNLLVT